MFYYDKEIDWQLLAGVKWPGQLIRNQKKCIFDNFNEMYHWSVQEIFMKTKTSAFGLHPDLQSRTDLQVVLKPHAKSYPYPSKAFRQVVNISRTWTKTFNQSKEKATFHLESLHSLCCCSNGGPDLGNSSSRPKE